MANAKASPLVVMAKHTHTHTRTHTQCIKKRTKNENNSLKPSHVINQNSTCTCRQKNTAIGAAYKVYWAGDVTGWGFPVFPGPLQIKIAIIPSLLLLFTSCFAIKNPRSRAFDRGVTCRNRARIDRETFVWLSLKWDDCLWSGTEGKMYTTEINSGWTAWQTQIDAVLLTERKLNNYFALVVNQSLSSE